MDHHQRHGGLFRSPPYLSRNGSLRRCAETEPDDEALFNDMRRKPLQFTWISTVLVTGTLLATCFAFVAAIVILDRLHALRTTRVWEIAAGIGLTAIIVGIMLIASRLAVRWLGHDGSSEAVDPTLCRICGYNLTGNVSGVCPECGTAIS